MDLGESAVWPIWEYYLRIYPRTTKVLIETELESVLSECMPRAMLLYSSTRCLCVWEVYTEFVNVEFRILDSTA
jgi:Na+/H+ antiporter NhaB